MTYKILVPLDGSCVAERAISWADALGHRLEADLELLRVVSPEEVGPSASETEFSRSLEELMGEARSMLQEEQGSFHQVLDSHCTVLEGMPAETIAAHAQFSGSDLIIMGSHGYEGLLRTLHGSMADTVIRESGRPVLVVPEAASYPRDPTIHRVLVPLDGSQLAEGVLPCVTQLAQSLRWTLMLFWVAGWPPQALPVQGGLIPLHDLRQTQPDMVEYLQRKVAELRDQGVDADFRIWFGDRQSGATAFAAEAQVDLIALSTHGRHGLGRWLLGSTLEYTLAHARQPVLAMRPTEVPVSSQELARQLLRPAAPREVPRITLQLTPAQADVVRIALDQLAWAASHHNVVRDEVGKVRGALDAATAMTSASATGHGDRNVPHPHR